MSFILAVVQETAGSSARQGYVEARRQQRRQLAKSVAFALAVPLFVAAAVFLLIKTEPGVEIALGLAAVCALAAWWTWPAPDAERWLRGASGEAATARVLAKLPDRRWVVRHDLSVPGSNANIDHLVIGPSGVWCIDTKTTRAEVKAGWLSVRLGGRRLDTRPVRWEAKVVAERLRVPVRPLIVVHGRGLRRRGGRSGRVRVVGPVILLRVLRRGARRGQSHLTPDDVALLSTRSEQIFPSYTAQGQVG
jgi:hypothetical protein